MTHPDSAGTAIPGFGPFDFVVSSTSRDPFRAYPDHRGIPLLRFDPCTHHARVAAKRFPLSELKLKGVLSGGAPKALFEDPTGFGWVVDVGDRIANRECVSLEGQSERVGLSWRVDQITDAEVVLVLDNEAHPEFLPKTLRLELYADS